MTAPLRILMAEDLASDAELEERELRRAGLTFVSQRVETRAAFTAALAEFQPDLILSDYRMPMFDGMEALALAIELAPGTPVIIVTGSVNEETAVECIKSGAVDYVLKGHLGRLAPAVRAALEQRHAEAERRRAEAARQASEQRYRSLFESASDAIFVADAASGMLVDANGRALALTGRTLDEVRTLHQTDLVAPDYTALARDAFRRVTQGERGGVPRYLIRHRDGHDTPVEISASRIQDATGRTLVVGVFRDLSERERADDALRESEQRFRLVVESAPEGILVHQDGRLVYANVAAARLFGAARPADLLDTPLLDRVHPAFRDLVRERVRLASDRGQLAEPIEEVLLRLDDTPFDAEVVGVPFSHEGQPASLAFFHDVTARKRAEAERALLGAALEQAAEAAIITDTSGAIEYVNPAFERITGWRRAEVMGRNPRVLKSGVQGAEHYREMWSTLSTGGVVSGTFVNRRKDGSHYEAEGVIFPVRDAAGSITQYVSLQRDVTHEHELAEQLRQSQKMEALGQMTGGITHDFNNLLGVILANAALLKPKVPSDDPAVARFVDDLTEAAHRATDMVRKLLAFSRRERMTMQPVDLGRALRDIENTLRRLLPETIEIVLTAPAAGPTVSADPGAVEQILLNLATNARDAMPGGGTLAISVEPWDPPSAQAAEQAGLAAWESCTCVRVTDSGTGMDAATAARAMEPFFTTKPRGEGTGLGLAMVFGLMHQQGGQVLLASEPGVGTTVRLIFRAGSPETQLELPTEAEVLQGSGTILVVEDQEMLCRAIAEVLQQLGYTVISSADGLEALEILAARGEEIRLVLSDVVMPRMGGIRLYERLRERGNPIPVVLMSGYAADGDEAATPLGVPLIEKPWTVEALARQVSAALKGPGTA
jgi:PAS domain S-box-containing protein